jgi:hypothetical protein
MKNKIPESTDALAKFLGVNGAYGLLNEFIYPITFVLIFPSDQVQVIWITNEAFSVIDYERQTDFYNEWKIIMPLNTIPQN